MSGSVASEYYRLTDRQQEIVDAAADHPDWTNREISEHVDSGESYVSEVLSGNREVVAAVRNGALDEDSDGDAEPAAQPAVEWASDGLVVRLPEPLVRQALREGALPDAVYAAVASAVARQAFDRE